MKYRIMRMPVWLLGILTAAFSACFFPIWLSTVLGLVEWNDAVVGGLFCGSAMALLLPLIRKRFEPPLEPPLTTDERIAAARALDHSRPSDDPRVQAAAIFFAKQIINTRASGNAFPWLMVGISVQQLIVAASKNPWLWFMFAASVVGIRLITVNSRRSYKRALELLAAADSPVQPVTNRQVRG